MEWSRVSIYIELLEYIEYAYAHKKVTDGMMMCLLEMGMLVCICRQDFNHKCGYI